MVSSTILSGIAEDIINDLSGVTYLEGIAICEVVKHHLLTKNGGINNATD